MPGEDNYLCVKKGGEMIAIHRALKMEEVEKLAKDLKRPIEDIHVHHANGNKFDNTMNNLEPMSKDRHAKQHGANNWDELLERGKK